MSGIVGDIEVVMAVRFAVPPGTTPQKAGQMLSQGGINVPLGLMQYVIRVDVTVLGAGQPYENPVLAVEGGGRFQIVQ